jgi:hypothetical protein
MPPPTRTGKRLRPRPITSRRPLPATLALLLVVCAGTPGWAEGKLEPPDLDRYVRWGALRARPRIEVKDVGVDDNILASSTLEISDYTATITPSLEGLLLFGSRAFLDFRSSVEYTAYLNYPDQNFPDWRNKARLTAPSSRFGLFAEFEINRLKSRPADLEDIRPDRDEDGIAFGAIMELGGHTEVEIGRHVMDYRHSDPDYSAFGQDIAERLDRQERRTVLDASLRLTDRTRLTLYSDIGDIDFVDPDPLGRSKDSTLWSFVPGIGFGAGGPLSGSARGGWSAIDSDDATRTDFAGVVGEAKLRWRPIRRGSLGLEWYKRPSFSVYEDATYLLDSSTELSGLYYLSWPIGIEGSVAAGKLTFPGSRSGREDDILEYEFGFRLRLSEDQRGRRVEYSLTWNRWESDSNIEGLDRSRTIVGLGAVVGY